MADYSEYFDPLKVLLPQSEQEIVDIVKTAASKQQQVRVLGSGHSRNSLAFSEDVIVSLEGYKGTVHLDRQAQQVRMLPCGYWGLQNLCTMQSKKLKPSSLC